MVVGAASTYSYDAVGNVIGVSDKINGTNAGNTNYVYDLLDRATRITQSSRSMAQSSTKAFWAEILSDRHQGRSGNSDELRSRIYFISWSEALSIWLHSLVVLASTKFQCIHQRF
jgi:hypothetical protein